MSSALVVAICLLFSPTPQPPGFKTVEEALTAARAGEALQNRVPRPVAVAAADRIARAPGIELESLMAIGRAGGADKETARALAARLETLDDEAPAAARLLVTLPGATASTSALVRLAEKQVDERTTRAACDLIVRGPSSGVVHQLEAWLAEPETAPLFEALITATRAGGPDPAELVAALTHVDIEDENRQVQLSGAISSLVDRHPAAAARALSLVQGSDNGPGNATLRALGSYPIDRWQEAAPVVLSLLSGISGQDPDVPAVLHASAGLLLPEAIPVAFSIVDGANPPRNRAAAVLALGVLCAGDERLIDMLIPLLSDPAREVVGAAHQALMRRTGMRLPAEISPWLAWRVGAKLPAPVDDTERLDEQRQNMISARRPPEERRD